MRPTVLLSAILFTASLVPASAVAQEDADTRELAAYKLTMAKLTQLNGAMAEAQKQRGPGSAQQELEKKKRELAALAEKENPTEAELERMAVLEDEISRAEDDEGGISLNDNPSLTDMANQLTADPAVAAALKRAGLAPREAATMLMAYLQAALAVGLMESTGTKEIPPGVSAENVRFVQANKAALEALFALNENR